MWPVSRALCFLVGANMVFQMHGCLLGKVSLFVLFCVFVVGEGRRHVFRQFDPVDKSKRSHVSEEFWFTQKLDHFNGADSRVWKQVRLPAGSCALLAKHFINNWIICDKANRKCPIKNTVHVMNFWWIVGLKMAPGAHCTLKQNDYSLFILIKVERNFCVEEAETDPPNLTQAPEGLIKA